jgi:uncharacterized OB-fold protein
MAEMNKKIEMKPCPFCGGKVKGTLRNLFAGVILFIKCTKCGAVISFDNARCICKPAEAVEYYNTRAEGKVEN